MQFLQINDNGTRTIKGHPGWRKGDTPETARLLTDEELVAAGFGLMIIDDVPVFDSATQTFTADPVADWPTTSTTTTKTYTVADKPPPGGDDVNAERDRRVVAGSIFTVAGYGDIPATGRAEDQTNMLAQLIKASAYEAAGVTAPVLVFRDADNVNHMLTPLQMKELVSLGTQWVEDTMAVSWAMKDGDAPFEAGIPTNYRDDVHWP